jgi:hypothetical protein
MEIMIGTTISGISYQLMNIYTPYADVARMLINIMEISLWEN